MPTVAELTAPYEHVLVRPRRGANVCRFCCNLTDGYDCCWACEHGGRHLDALSPISYSIAGEPLHHALAAYKRGADDTTNRTADELAAMLSRHLQTHERCLARQVGISGFDLVTTVPSGDRHRDPTHPLHRLVANRVHPVRSRYERILERTQHPAVPHAFDAERFSTTTDVNHRSVLLIDDMWTTGATAQSAARALKRAGAQHVAAVVIGRHVHRDWCRNDRRLASLAQRFDWDQCVDCDEPIAAPTQRLAQTTGRV